MCNKNNNSTPSGVNILSLFDGMACGMLAFMGLGVNVENYYAYEIDKYAIKTTEHNFPNIKQCGDVFEADFTQYKDIDYLIGGSPCTFWSIAQSPDKRETTASGLGWELFSQYVRALKEVKPKYFLYENNKSMSKAIYKSISDSFGFEPILINSALVSAQNRNRYYWCGKRNEDGTYSKVDIPQPQDRGILLRDILEGNDLTCGDKGYTVDGKSQTIKAQYQQTSIANICKYNSTYGASGVAEPVGTTKDDKSYCLTSGYSNGSGEKIGNYVTHTLEKGCKSMVAEEVEPINTTKDGKSQCLRATCYKDTVRNIVGNDVDRKTGVAESVRVGALPRPNGELSKSQGFRIYDISAKSVSLKSQAGGAGGKTGLYAVPVENESSPKRVCTLSNHQGDRIYSQDGKSICQSAIGHGGLAGHTGAYAIPVDSQFEFQDLNIRNKAHIAINENAIRGVQDKNNASCAENFYEFTDTKANTLTTAHKPKIIDELDNYKRYAEPCEWNDNGEPTKAISFADGKKYIVYSIVDGQIEIKGKTYPIKLKDGYYIIRKLTVKECMRLQTVPEWYDFSVISNSQAYKCLGNGWTIEVIKHLLKYYLNE